METPGQISTKFTGVGPFNTVFEMMMRNEFKKISRTVLRTKVATILENVLKKTSVIDQLYVNVAQ